MDHPKTISGSLMCLVLNALRETNGAQYTAILRKAGWEQYIDHPPPNSAELIGSQDDFQRLSQTTCAMLGEDLFRLYQRNTGLKIIEGALAGPWGAYLRSQVPTIAPSDQIAWLLREHESFMAKGGIHHTLSEDATAYYVEQAHCLACQGVTGVVKPVCAGNAAVPKKIIEVILGRRVNTAEIACHAVDGSHCKVAIYK
jgi:hypothetical protein